MKSAVFAVAIPLLIVGCRTAQRATAELEATTRGSKVYGTATFTRAADGGVAAEIRLAGAPPGLHAIHIHEHGNCGQAGNAAGGHFNPSHVKHGFLPKDGAAAAHAGDMGNILIRPNGRGALSLILPGLTLDRGPRGIEGRSVILHEKVDDFGQPTGNAGGRIACGVITIKKN